MTLLHLEFSVLGPRCSHLSISADTHAEESIIHHHEIILGLTLKIQNPGFPCREVPHFNRLSDRILAVCRKLNTNTLQVGFLTKLNTLSCVGNFASSSSLAAALKQIYGHARNKHLRCHRRHFNACFCSAMRGDRSARLTSLVNTLFSLLLLPGYHKDHKDQPMT